MPPSVSLKELKELVTRDSRGTIKNEKKHASFLEGFSLFRDPLFVVFDDPDHSQTENRYIIIGHSSQNRLLIAGYLERAERVRLIWARKTSRRERKPSGR